MEHDPTLNLKDLEQIIRLPQLKVEQQVPESIHTLVVILKPADIANVPPFLKVINENEFMKDDLTKKKSLFIYGRAGDQFKRCYIKVSTFQENVTTLSDASIITRTLLSNDIQSVNMYFAESITPEQIAMFIQGLCLTNYKFDRKSDPKARFKPIDSVTIYHPTFSLDNDQAKYTISLAKYPLLCRELVNSRALEANPVTMLELCKQIAQNNPNISMEAIVGKELQAKGLNLIYSVGRGAAKPPCLVIFKYQGNPEKPEDLIALIGKGVCFDAGGLNIKGTGNIETMYYDKGGACTVLAAFLGAVELKLPVNVVCGMAFVENLVSAESMHPLDIIKSYKGLTVEIGNTDAEGRLILADTMSYTQLNYKPHTMIEFSTLTGAIKTAIGNLAGIFTNNQKLSSELSKIGSSLGESFWPLPLLSEHRTNMKGTHGDLNNKSKNPAAGASNAAAFLEYFVEKGVAWVHLDIAEAAFTASDRFVYSTGATGFGVPVVLEYLRRRQQVKAEEAAKAESQAEIKTEEKTEASQQGEKVEGAQ